MGLTREQAQARRDADTPEIIRRRKEGEQIWSIAKSMHYTQNTIRKILQRQGLTPTKVPDRFPELKDEFFRMVNDPTVQSQEIVKKLGVPSWQFQEWLRQHGIDRRKLRKDWLATEIPRLYLEGKEGHEIMALLRCRSSAITENLAGIPRRSPALNFGKRPTAKKSGRKPAPRPKLVPIQQPKAKAPPARSIIVKGHAAEPAMGNEQQSELLYSIVDKFRANELARYDPWANPPERRTRRVPDWRDSCL